MQKEGIAIIGIGCRFPGGINDTEAFWKVLAEGRDVVSEVPADRWNVERFYDAEPGIAGKSVAKRGGFLAELDQFDPQFFGISPREAPYIDPQQRLLLETAWEAIEDAGIVLDLENGTDIGVFMGVSHNDYQNIQSGAMDRSGISAHSPTGSAHSIGANRISYCFNLKGPSMSMDTACSSALTAVHVACEQIMLGRCKMALAGGVTVMITPDGFIGFSQAGMLSPDGNCKAFSAEANGFVRGEGAGVVLLKPLSQAIKDGDPIHGVIIGTSLNQDGHTNGISLPSPEAQARLVRDACIDAGINPSQVGFVEAHGTGTAVGDPIEATALANALCEDRKTPLPIGSVKTNLGHLETAAGVVGLVKGLLVLKRGQIPPSLHFENPSTHIDFDALKLRVPTKIEPFPKTGGRRIVGVNSFGFGGANAHVILAEAPAHTPTVQHPSTSDRGWPIVLSARSENALKAAAAQLGAWVEDHEKSNGTSNMLPSLTYTLGARRNHHSHRLTVVSHTADALTQELKGFASAEATGSLIRTSFTPRPEHAPRIGFVMSGQGPQWWGMGRELMKSEPVFRKTMEACAAAMAPHARFSLLEELGRDEATTKVSQTEIGQPAIFAMQVSLFELWKSIGVTPAAIVGHSVGEIAAACAAGVLSLEEGARIIVLRARLMNDCARGDGTMLAVGLSEDEALAVIANHDKECSIAAFNGPRSLTISGKRESLEAIHAELEPKGIFARFVRVDHPFHHAMMQPAADALTRELAGLKPQEETVPFFSTVTGQRCSGKDCTPAHWGRGIRQSVQFVSAVNAVADFGVDMWLEISSHPALSISIQECLTARSQKAPVTASTRREREHDSFLEAALDLHRGGVTLDFAAMTPSRELLTLPAYPWDKSRWWHESSELREARLGTGGKGLLEMRLPRATPTWHTKLDARHMAYLKDHKVDTHVIFPGAGFVEIALEVGVQLFEGRPFAIEDFEIRKPLILAEQTGVIIEVTYEPAERTFTIQSRFDNSASWSVHVVGSLRAERTESSFANTTYEAPESEMESQGINGFYGHMSDLGLKYGEEFRSVRELWAGGGKGAGKVSLSDGAAPRASEYALHPVLLDGALHVFSAGAKTVEDRRAKMKLPVRFAKILYLRSPGASSLVRAKVLHFNEELIEGRIAIYDEAERPCVLVDGFRAISMSAARRTGGSGGGRDVVYHVEWERSTSTMPATKPQPPTLQHLRDAASIALNQVLSLRGRSELEKVMQAEDEIAASQIAQGLCEMGLSSSDRKGFTISSLGVAPAMRKAFTRLMDKLVKRGLVTVKGAAYKPTKLFFRAAASASKDLRSFIEDHPGHLPEVMLSAATGAEFGPIIRGEKDAVQVLFGGANADLLDHFYGDGLFSSHWMTSIAAAVQEAARRLPEGRGLRILEVGAGTAGLAAQLLPLLERGVHSYTFTDVSAGFFPGANQKLAAFPEVEYKILDLEKPAIDQGFEPDSYDFVVGTNVIHAVADVRATLRTIHDLLAPSGTLMFMDVATAQLWTESVFGLTSGWWHLTDSDLRPEQPLMQREQWEAALRQSGFAEVVSLPGLQGPEGEGQVGIIGRKADAPVSAQETAIEGPVETSWVIFSDQSPLAKDLVGKVTSNGARCRIVLKGKKFASKDTDRFTINPEDSADWKQLLAKLVEDSAPDRMVYLWSAQAETGLEESDSLMDIHHLLHLTHALEESMAVAKLRLDLITRGAQPAGRDMGATAVPQAASIGIFRVILSEHPNFVCRGIDLPQAASAADIGALWHELLLAGGEREVALRGEARFVQRITRGMPTREQKLDPSIPLRLESRERGLLDSLRFTPFAPQTPGKGEVLIKVKAAGMNFRDVLKALALYPAETIDARIFGDEVGGEIVAVGEGVTHLSVGDRAFGLAYFGLATETLARAADVRRMPKDLSFEEAATIPVVFMTAWYALKTIARIKAGDIILVHAGAGGVGMAAIQIAHHLGADVIASAGSPTKRALLKTLGVKHVIDSRKGDFAEAVMELTNGRGVDIVLNALASEAIPMGLSCLAESGRFVEIGKRDIYQNSRIPLWSLRKNCSFHVVAMDAVFQNDEEQTRALMAEITTLVEKGKLTPLPFRSYPVSRIDAAFRLMAGGKHTGKVVVAFADPFIIRKGEPPLPPFNIKSDAAYLITGGLGGFGRVLAEWLVECGARHLVLSSRSGASTPEAVAFVEKMQARGVDTKVIKADVSSPKDVKRLIADANSATPLKGIFHLAMVIDDAPLSALTPERLDSVMGPKAHGAWLLHENTKSLELDCFVMFSSVSSIFGNPAQGNYSAANAFLDSLSHHRRALGLPALAINWGVLGGEGYVARNERVAEFLARQGTAALTPGEVTTLLESFLNAHATQVAAIRVDWAKWRQSFRGMQENPLVERIFAAGVDVQESSGGSSDWRGRIAAASADERDGVVSLAVRDVVGAVLRVKPESLRDDQPLTDLGLDSLMGVEIETMIEGSIGVALPPTSLMRARTIGQIAALISEHLGGGADAAKPKVEAPAEVAAPAVSEVDIDALSDLDLDRLLGGSSVEKASDKELLNSGNRTLTAEAAK